MAVECHRPRPLKKIEITTYSHNYLNNVKQKSKAPSKISDILLKYWYHLKEERMRRLCIPEISSCLGANPQRNKQNPIDSRWHYMVAFAAKQCTAVIGRNSRPSFLNNSLGKPLPPINHGYEIDCNLITDRVNKLQHSWTSINNVKANLSILQNSACLYAEWIYVDYFYHYYCNLYVIL